MNFIQLKEQTVSVDSIVKVDAPRKVGTGIEWYIRTMLDSTKSPETFLNSYYSTEEEASKDYERIVKQLCNDK